MKVKVTLNNVGFGYSPAVPVLQVDEIALEGGNVIFLTGVSGIGKSTFMEGIGLMNDTLLTDSESTTSLEFADKKYDYFGLMDNSTGDDELIRNQHFSFLFQENNLMSHFTVEENILLPHLIKGIPHDEAISRSLGIAAKLGIPQSFYTRAVSALSGGQRQRVSFIRSLSLDFDVLFADEPTGNIDPVTAGKMMQVLKERVKEQNALALVVTHDIKLAVNFGDQILPIKSVQEGERRMGYLDKSLLLCNENGKWFDYRDDPVTDIHSHLLN